MAETQADYNSLLTALLRVFEGDEHTSDARVFVEEDPQFDMQGAQRVLLITLDSHVPSPRQGAAAGLRVRWDVAIDVWCGGFAMSFSDAATLRNRLVAEVEIVLAANRTLNGACAHVELRGGEFLSVRNPQTNMFESWARTSINAEQVSIAV